MWQARPLQDHVWLKSRSFAVIPASQWPGAGSTGDHDMDEVEARCVAFDAASREPEAA
jgi:hypothetical protein